jgi:regulator of RNase E activity RraA
VIDGVAIRPGDLVFGDADGVVIVPRSVELPVLESAWRKITGENLTRQALQQGRLLADVYREYGIL